MSYSVGRFDHILLGNDRSHISLEANAAGTALVFTGSLALRTIGPHVIGSGETNATQLLRIVGSFSGGRYGLVVGPTLSPGAGNTSALLHVNGTIAEASSGTHSYFAAVEIVAPTITAGAAALTSAAALRVNGQPTGATNNYALWVADGMSFFNQATAAGAVPVLSLKQDDVDQDWFEFDTTIGTGNATEAVAAKTLTTTHFLKVTITGVGARYIPVGTIA